MDPDPDPPRRVRNHRWTPIPFKDAIPATVRNLVKLAAGSDPRSSSFAVFETSPGEMSVWGLVDQQNQYHEFINYNSESGPQRPGRFQVTALGLGHIRVSIGYENIAELKVNKLVRTRPDVLTSGPVASKLFPGVDSYIKSVAQSVSARDFETDFNWQLILRNYWTTSICRLLLRIQCFRHGGAVLITPDLGGTHLNIKHSIHYDRLHGALFRRAKFLYLRNRSWKVIHQDYASKRATEMPLKLYFSEAVNDGEQKDAASEVDGAIWFTSLLSRVDGLVLMDNDLEVHGFGVEITVTDEPKVVYLTDDPLASAKSLRKCPYTHFGTRHRSMMRYCAAVPGAVGFVISQDGEVRAITTVSGRVVMWEDIKLQLADDRPPRQRRRIVSPKKNALLSK